MNGLGIPLRLLPSTMFGRLAGSLLLVLGVTLAVVVAIVMRDRDELSLRVGGVGDTSHRIEWVTHHLEALQGDARKAERKRLIADPEMRVEPERYPGKYLNRNEVAAIKRAFVAELNDRLGENYEIDLHRIRDTHRLLVIPLAPDAPHVAGTTALDVSVTLRDGDTLVFRVAPPMPDPPLPWALFIQLGAVTLLLVVMLFLVTRSITRPLSKLAQAADGVERNVRHPPLPEEGVREIREATRAFNTMQDRLLRYLDSRTRVLAAMSHDLRTPLTRLRLRVESVSDGQLYARFVADLDEMEDLVRGALGILKGLEDDEAFERLDVNALLATLVAEYSEVGADVSLEGTARDPVSMKPRALKRCLTNLVDNALKFGERATIGVVDDDEALVIRVSDEGPGIAEESLERVFEPFYRLEASRSRDTGGTGLGLSIARDIAQAHGGTLTLRNRPEGGLTAELRVPRR